MKLLAIPTLALLMLDPSVAFARPTECFALERKSASMVQKIDGAISAANVATSDADANRKLYDYVMVRDNHQTSSQANIFLEAANKAEVRHKEHIENAETIKSELQVVLQEYLDRDCVQNSAEYDSVMWWMK